MSHLLTPRVGWAVFGPSQVRSGQGAWSSMWGSHYRGLIQPHGVAWAQSSHVRFGNLAVLIATAQLQPHFLILGEPHKPTAVAPQARFGPQPGDWAPNLYFILTDSSEWVITIKWIKFSKWKSTALVTQAKGWYLAHGQFQDLGRESPQESLSKDEVTHCT